MTNTTMIKPEDVKRLREEFRKQLPELVTRAPEMPRLLHAWLSQQVSGQHHLHMHSRDLNEISRSVRELQRRIVASVFGTGLLIAAAVLYGLDAGGPRLWSVPASAWVAVLGGVGALLAAWPRDRRRRPEIGAEPESPTAAAPDVPDNAVVPVEPVVE